MPEPSSIKDQLHLLSVLAAHDADSPYQVRVVVVGSEENPVRLAEKYAPFRLAMQKRGDLTAGEFSYAVGDTRLTGTVYFCPTRHNNITYIISVCSGTVWQRSVLRLVRALYPKMVQVFLSQKELLDLLRQVRSIFPESDLRITGHSKKKRLRAESRRKYETSRTKTEKSLEAVFSEAEADNHWFSAISFDVIRRANEEKQLSSLFTSATLSKYGFFSCTSQFDRFFYGIVEKLADLAKDKMKFFSNRSRKVTPHNLAKPISITYDSPVFASPDRNKDFVKIMRKMSSSSCSVIHANPYIHLSVVDGTDGSAADVWVVRNDEILLVPQLQASEAALKRFVNYIFEEWHEGNLSSPVSDGIRQN